MKNKKEFIPSKQILEKYADVLVNFALGSGKGIKKNDVVQLTCHAAASPLYLALYRAIIKAGGHVISSYKPDEDDRLPLHKDFYLFANNDQLEFFPEKYLRGLVEQCDHSIYILSDTDKHALQGVEPQRVMKHSASFKPYMDWRRDKENAGKFTWTLALYGTEAMAKEAKLSPKDYWQQIIKACFLDEKDPIAKWREVYREMEEYRKKLNKLPIEKLHVESKDADLWITLGEKRQWIGGSGRNIPSFELFTSPDWRGTNGWIRFSEPLYRYGNLIEGIELEFKDGKVVKSSATKNYSVLKEMISQRNADKIGEFSMTDRRFSRITKFMAETLFDENIGGRNGNTHLALGNSYHDTYAGNPMKMKEKDWAKLGFNDSSVHTDIISTAPRTITAILKSGKEKVIYQDGQFTL